MWAIYKEFCSLTPISLNSPLNATHMHIHKYATNMFTHTYKYTDMHTCVVVDTHVFIDNLNLKNCIKLDFLKTYPTGNKHCSLETMINGFQKAN